MASGGLEPDVEAEQNPLDLWEIQAQRKLDASDELEDLRRRALREPPRARRAARAVRPRGPVALPRLRRVLREPRHAARQGRGALPRALRPPAPDRATTSAASSWATSSTTPSCRPGSADLFEPMNRKLEDVEDLAFLLDRSAQRPSGEAEKPTLTAPRPAASRVRAPWRTCRAFGTPHDAARARRWPPWASRRARASSVSLTLRQVHGARVVDARHRAGDAARGRRGRAAPTGPARGRRRRGLPAPAAGRAASQRVLALVHSGWRGTAAGVVGEAVAPPRARCTASLPDDAPGRHRARRCAARTTRSARRCRGRRAAVPECDGLFRPTRPGHALLDLGLALERQLHALGVARAGDRALPARAPGKRSTRSTPTAGTVPPPGGTRSWRGGPGRDPTPALLDLDRLDRLVERDVEGGREVEEADEVLAAVVRRLLQQVGLDQVEDHLAEVVGPP